MPPDDVIERLRAQGWRQGSVLPLALQQQIAESGSVPFPIEAGSRLLVASHDCDVNHRSLEVEPALELIKAREIDPQEIDGNLTRGKNPRVLHLKRPAGASLELRVQERFLVSRERLAGASPDESVTIDQASKGVLSRWLANRYRRPAFPDAFANRLTATEERISDKLRRKAKDVSGIYLLLDPPGEAEEGQDYRVVIRMVMPVAEYDDPDRRTTALEALSYMHQQMDECNGISVLDSQLQSEAEITLDDVLRLRRWDTHDMSPGRGVRHEPLPPEL